MRRFRSIYIILPLIILVFFAGVQPAQAGLVDDWGDVAGWVGIAGGTAACIASLGIACVVGGVVAFFSSVFSGLLGDVILGPIVQGLVSVVSNVLVAMIAAIGQFLFTIAIGTISGALELTGHVQDSIAVKEGFDIVLDVANLGLVISIIVGAFMVMLRRSNASNILIRLIAVALLINFSFFIVTNFLIKPVNEITEVLLTAANFDINSFSSIFKPDVNWGELAEQVDFSGGEDIELDPDAQAGWVEDVMIRIFSVIFYASFVLIGAFSLFAFAIMLFIRFVALSFLIVLMPIAWVSWIFPGLKIAGGHPAQQWWEQFTRWLLFAPVVMFFFFLAIKLVAVDNLPALVDRETEPIYRVIAAASSMFLVVGFLLGGLIVANKMSITGAGYAMKLAQKAGKGVQKYAKKQGLKAATAPLRTKGGRRATEAVQKFGQRNKFTRALTAPTRGAATAAANLRRRGEALYAEDTKKVDKMKLEEQVRQVGTMSSTKRLSVMKNLREARGSAVARHTEAIGVVDQAISSGAGAEEVARLRDDVRRRMQQVHELNGLIDSLPRDIAASFEKLERLYGEHETAPRKEKKKAGSGGDVASAPTPAAPAGGGTPP